MRIASHLFMEAFLYGIRQSVAYPLVNTVMTDNGVQIENLNDIAFAIFKRGQMK